MWLKRRGELVALNGWVLSNCDVYWELKRFEEIYVEAGQTSSSTCSIGSAERMASSLNPVWMRHSSGKMCSLSSKLALTWCWCRSTTWNTCTPALYSHWRQKRTLQQKRMEFWAVTSMHTLNCIAHWRTLFVMHLDIFTKRLMSYTAQLATYQCGFNVYSHFSFTTLLSC